MHICARNAEGARREVNSTSQGKIRQHDVAPDHAPPATSRQSRPIAAEPKPSSAHCRPSPSPTSDCPDLALAPCPTSFYKLISQAGAPAHARSYQLRNAGSFFSSGSCSSCSRDWPPCTLGMLCCTASCRAAAEGAWGLVEASACCTRLSQHPLRICVLHVVWSGALELGVLGLLLPSGCYSGQILAQVGPKASSRPQHTAVVWEHSAAKQTGHMQQACLR